MIRLPTLPPERPFNPLSRVRSVVRGEVRTGRHDRMLYATDASLYQVEPLGVVLPADASDAERAVASLCRQNIAVLPRGGGTSLAGQCTAEAVVLDLTAGCGSIETFDAAARVCRVGAGMTIGDLNREIADSGLYFAPDPSTYRQASIGGCIGNNAAGSHSILYGRTSESLLCVDLCLSTGETVRLDRGAALRDGTVAKLTEAIVAIVKSNERLIRERFPKTKRRNAGYALDSILQQLDEGDGDLGEVNLAKLVAGSEGTLGLVLSAELLLHPVPRAKGLAVASFASVQEAIDAVVPILGTSPAAVELLDDMVIGLARQNNECKHYVELLPRSSGVDPNAVLYVEYFDKGEAGPVELEARFEALRALLPGCPVATYTDADSIAEAWALRVAGEPLLHGLPGTRKPLGFVEDNAVPPERLSEFVRRFREIVTEEGTTAAFYAHASVGVLHVRPLLDIRDAEDEGRMHRIASRVADLAAELGGVMSGEHGDGRVRGPLLERLYGPELMKAFAEVKAVFDPRNLMNPGNIVAPGQLESISARLRVKPSLEPVSVDESVETYFSYDDQHTFSEAVEMCNGAGVCRKKTGGVMCPSYMATLDERHSTRGRGNALRLAISGQFGEQWGRADWRDKDTQETLDLCLSCKACKSECPSNVDIARLKAEYTAQGFAETSPPLATLLMGEIRTLSRLASAAPKVTNALNGFGPVRKLLNRTLGVHPDRSLPCFNTALPKSWGRTQKRGPIVAFFGDCFSMYNEPGIGLAAKRLLESFGYGVELPLQGAHGCCGRPAISLGLLPRAAEMIDDLILDLRPWIESNEVPAILFAEPSCLSAVKDDWLSLRTRAPQWLKEQLAGKSYLVEQFLEARWDQHPSRPPFGAPTERVTFHGHCHQKALEGADSSAGLLRRVLGEKLEVLDSTCCGMAGSFGYAEHRYDLSMRIGELGVLPAARRAGAMVATGTSCRHQIRDGAKVESQHPVELLASLLER